MVQISTPLSNYFDLLFSNKRYENIPTVDFPNYRGRRMQGDMKQEAQLSQRDRGMFEMTPMSTASVSP